MICFDILHNLNIDTDVYHLSFTLCCLVYMVQSCKLELTNAWGSIGVFVQPLLSIRLFWVRSSNHLLYNEIYKTDPLG